jgi:uncharacterized protein (TIGR02996 family)
VTHDDAFLQAIIESPDDDTPRLIYADWLEEHGQPERADFIRVQCELAHVPDEDSRRDPLEARQSLLLEDQGVKWAGPLRGLANRCAFQRGFVDTVVLDAPTFLRRGKALLRATPIEHARLFMDRTDLRTLAGSPLLARLRELDLSFRLDAPFRVADLRAFLDSPCVGGLRGLGLSGLKLGRAGVKALVASPVFGSLKRLQLDGAGLDVVAGTEQLVAQALANLVTLDVRFSRAGDGIAQVVASSPHLRCLGHLDLARTNLGDAGVRALAASPYLNSLEELVVHGNRIGDAGLEALAAAPQCASLRSLDFRSPMNSGWGR